MARTAYSAFDSFFSPSTTSTSYAPKSSMQASEDKLRSLANDIQTEEQRRYGQGISGLQGAYTDSRNALSSMIDPSLLFSKASDAVGAKSIQALNGFRQSLGARGLNPNSGVAGGMLQRLLFQNEQALTGASRDIAIENQHQRQTNAAINFANALNLSNAINAPVSGVNLETEQNIYEGQLAKYGIDKQAKATKDAGKNNILGGLIGAGASILGGLL